jgi:hypothetical protein
MAALIQSESSMSEIIIPDIYVDSGSPSFRGLYRQHTHADYNFDKAIKEIVDNVIEKCDKININLILRGNKLCSIKISDNYVHGFRNLNEKGSKNPLNLAHIRDGHADDNETSQFGIGLKAGSMSTAYKMTIITKTEEDGCFKVVSDYQEMHDLDTFKSKRFGLTKEEYMDLHGFECGTSILLEDIKTTICLKKDEKTLKDDLMYQLSDTYNGFIKENVELRVNGDLVYYKEPLYEMKQCEPFTKRGEIFQYEEDDDIKYYMRDENGIYFIYNNDTHRLLTDKQTASEMKKIKQLESIKIADVKSTFVYWCDYVDRDDLPFGKIDIIKKNRKLGTWFLKSGRNGCKSYTQSEITIHSKKIAEEMGLGYNKHMSSDIKNNLTDAIRKCIGGLTCGFNADTNSDQFEKLLKIAQKNKIVAEPVDANEPVDSNEPVEKKVVRKIIKKFAPVVEHKEKLEPAESKLVKEDANADMVRPVVDILPDNEPVTEINLGLFAETQLDEKLEKVDEPIKMNVVAEATLENIAEPAKRVSAHVVKQHAKGSISSEEYDLWIQKMVEHKENYMHDARTRTAYNAFMY